MVHHQGHCNKTLKIRTSSILLLLLKCLSLIDVTNAGCTWYDESYLRTCKSHQILLHQHSQDLEIKSSNYFQKEFHTIKFDHDVQGKVLRLKWISNHLNSKDELTFKLGCTNPKTVVDKFHEKPHDIYSHDGCVEIERNSVRSLKTDMTSFKVVAELIKTEGLHETSCPYYTSESYGDSGIIISENWPTGSTQSYSFACVWEIKTDSSKAIHINIMDLDLGVLSLYRQNYCADTLTIEESGVYSWYAKYKETYNKCSGNGYYNPNTHYQTSLDTGKSKLKIRFVRNMKPSYGKEGRGFVIGWTTYEKAPHNVYPTTTTTKKNQVDFRASQAIIPVVIFAVVISLLCGWKRRQMRVRAANAAARQNGQAAQVMAQYNRQRIINHNNNNTSQINTNNNNVIIGYRLNNNNNNINGNNIGINNHQYMPEMGKPQPFFLPPPQYTEVAQPGQLPPSYDEIEQYPFQTPTATTPSPHHQSQTRIGGITTTSPRAPEPSSPAVLPYPPPTMVPPGPSAPAVLPYPPLQHGYQLPIPSNTLQQAPPVHASHQQQQSPTAAAGGANVLALPPPPYRASEVTAQPTPSENLGVIRVSPAPPP